MFCISAFATDSYPSISTPYQYNYIYKVNSTGNIYLKSTSIPLIINVNNSHLSFVIYIYSGSFWSELISGVDQSISFDSSTQTIYESDYDIKKSDGSVFFQANMYTSTNISIGGLIGESSNSNISNSFSRVAVTGTEGSIGGFVGKVTNGSISNSYSIGTLTGTNVKGFLNSMSSTTITNCFWNTDNVATSNGGTGLTTSQLKNQSSLVGWDFDNIWSINPLKNNGYPYLK